MEDRFTEIKQRDPFLNADEIWLIAEVERLRSKVEVMAPLMPFAGVEPWGSDPDQEFEVFWKKYPRRAGAKVGKASAKKQWMKLKPAERMVAFARLDEYSTAKGQYPEDAERYLRHKRWVGLEVELPKAPPPRPPAGPVPSSEIRDDAPPLEAGAAKALFSEMRNTVHRKQAM